MFVLLPFITNASLGAVGARIDHVFAQTHRHQHSQGRGLSSTVTLIDCKDTRRMNTHLLWRRLSSDMLNMTYVALDGRVHKI
jgi:hypothetical protein